MEVVQAYLTAVTGSPFYEVASGLRRERVAVEIRNWAEDSGLLLRGRSEVFADAIEDWTFETSDGALHELLDGFRFQYMEEVRVLQSIYRKLDRHSVERKTITEVMERLCRLADVLERLAQLRVKLDPPDEQSVTPLDVLRELVFGRAMQMRREGLVVTLEKVRRPEKK